jgi:hypothetical protein
MHVSEQSGVLTHFKGDRWDNAVPGMSATNCVLDAKK